MVRCEPLQSSEKRFQGLEKCSTNHFPGGSLHAPYGLDAA